MSFEFATSSSSTCWPVTINPHEITAATTYSSGTANSNSHQITAVTTFPPYSTSTNFSAHEDDILENMRKEARECLDEDRYFKALELHEEILKNNQHDEDDRKSASSWNLSKNRLRDINELKKALCKNTILTSLNLNNNKLGSDKGKILTDALCQNTTLTSLNLILNDLGPKGGQILADALCKNTTLTFLNLTYNVLGSEGGKALAEALYENTTLTFLNIGGNSIGPEG
ncbi:hypothetical protein C2G38_2043434 [Gigaspora rosea]|uniref:Uncharacterized protein n=1 Tax=Gigaspora rosea TaxID=44941 RepID=A0A397UJV0_9GLOM|nr:hypothetical protein C2G38_2043434 [Gigaspora rosea]